MKRIVVTLVMLLASGVASAAQFGIQPGESYEQISKVASLKKVAPFTYSTSALPDGNIAFNSYTLVITPKQGLCKILAFTPGIESNAYGTGVKEKFAALFDALTTKYGKGEKIDTLLSGSIWNEPRDWMMGLAKKERYLEAMWSREHNSALSPRTEGIVLEAHGVSPNLAVITVAYQFTNFTSCSAAIKAAENSSL